MNKVFFHFCDENTNAEYKIPVLCTPTEWSDWFENDIDLDNSFVGELEEIAVHDVHDWEEEDGTFYIGFTSYEANNESKINTILSKWKQKLFQLGWITIYAEFIKVQRDK